MKIRVKKSFKIIILIIILFIIILFGIKLILDKKNAKQENIVTGIDYTIIEDSTIEKIKQDTSCDEIVESILKEIKDLENKIRTGEITLEDAKPEIILLKSKLNVETYHRFGEDIYKNIEEEEWAEETVDSENISK